MKRLLTIILISATWLTACKETDSLVNDTSNIKMKDSLNKLYPTLATGYINVGVKDFKDVTVTLGDKELFAENDTRKEEIAKQIADMVYQMYNENNYLDNGKVIFTPIEDRLHTSGDPVKEYDMHLEELIKANEK
ncbi:hypothetical protein CAP35_09260 [Chitinophagaceae bacterium IBVUCB1]|nr:hypothetical protein CAP35_09260 [Chitinophagaceae bacterium IBVUCB1]